MKVLFDHPDPFLLAHGGLQIQIEETSRALREIGVEVEYLRWWDESCIPNIIHFFGIASLPYIERAHRKSIKVVQTALFTDTCNRTDLQLRMQRWATRFFLSLPVAAGIKRQLSWSSFRVVDINVVGLQAERRVLEGVYRVPPERVADVPLGLHPTFLEAPPVHARGDLLIVVGTIAERKNVVALAQMAHLAKVPILFVGKPYSEEDPYWFEFRALVDDCYVRHVPHVSEPAELAGLYRMARGCVVMSRYENWCLVAHEAAACGLPLLLQRQNWSWERFGPEATYFRETTLRGRARELKWFYEHALSAAAPRVKLHTWSEVAQQLKQIYQRVLATSS